FIIEKDILVKEDSHIYEIIVVKSGEQKVTDTIFYEIGFYINDNPRLLALEFINKKIKTIKQIIQNINENASEPSTEMLKNMDEKLKKLEEVFLCLQR
ncbi:MAG TPA: tRNA (adenine(22)-N(1))-methyltransferase TrmK, partial [Oscillospiraceae bacterium]|nr:tRNA (adenine(22)-N(1))-methyltransferase TrmK [Oscillospiraceae bacterium]